MESGEVFESLRAGSGHWEKVLSWQPEELLSTLKQWQWHNTPSVCKWNESQQTDADVYTQPVHAYKLCPEWALLWCNSAGSANTVVFPCKRNSGFSVMRFDARSRCWQLSCFIQSHLVWPVEAGTLPVAQLPLGSRNWQSHCERNRSTSASAGSLAPPEWRQSWAWKNVPSAERNDCCLFPVSHSLITVSLCKGVDGTFLEDAWDVCCSSWTGSAGC